MAWLIQSNAEGPVIIADINLTFHATQIKDLDLIGRINAEKSNDLKLMLQKGFLKEIRKDKSVETIDENVVKKFNETIQYHQEIADKQAEQIKAVEKQNVELKQQNVELKQQNVELHSKMDVVLEEVRAFAEKFPLQIRTIAEAMRNIETERGHIAQQKESLVTSGASEAEIKMQEKILTLKDKKLEKNVKNLGSTVSHSADDFKDTLDALGQLDI